jgi:hypothetical protein
VVRKALDDAPISATDATNLEPPALRPASLPLAFGR